MDGSLSEVTWPPPADENHSRNPSIPAEGVPRGRNVAEKSPPVRNIAEDLPPSRNGTEDLPSGSNTVAVVPHTATSESERENVLAVPSVRWAC